MKLTRKITAWLILFAMVFALPGYVGVSADGDDSITVLMSVQAEGAFIVTPQSIEVTDGLAEQYGYEMSEADHNDVAVEAATVFDALVAAHKTLYGDSFTAETAANYLGLSGGSLTKAFGEPAGLTGYKVNSKMPADETGWGYLADTARIKDGDCIELWFYMDTTGWSDCYTAFDSYKKTTAVNTDTEFTISKTTYGENYAELLTAIDGTNENNYITINTVNADGSISEALDVAIDKDGKFALKFEEEGTYIITAQGMVDGYAPIVAPFCIVTVTKDGESQLPGEDGDDDDDNPPAAEVLTNKPTSVAGYLCIGSQYTNGEYGTNPEGTFEKQVKSLGNFGGYITYYYETPITDNPNNKYGMDFYVFGNAFSDGGSIAEPGQVYISEDGDTWYALAGSDHYDNAIWDYKITYKNNDDGAVTWSDNYGNEDVASATPWPAAENYGDIGNSYTFSGILLKSADGTILGDGTAGAFACQTKFGYVDYYAADMLTADSNPYIENPVNANGFDVAWAVDSNGVPINVADKQFHYVKIATASNIMAGAFGEKSTEVSYMALSDPQAQAVGKTDAPTSIVITDGATEKRIDIVDGQTVYNVNLDTMKYVSVKTIGTSDSDNIYINNKRVANGTFADGFKVTKENGETLVRIIVQNGDKEPRIYLLKLNSDATSSDELIEGINVNVSGAIRAASTKNGVDYSTNVGSRVSSISIAPVCDNDVEYTVNGEALAESYSLEYGKNIFNIVAKRGGTEKTFKLVVEREEQSGSSGEIGSNNISVSFTLYGDTSHGTGKTHTFKEDKFDLPLWIEKTKYTVSAGSYVLDVFEKAMEASGIRFVNSGGNYISEINGLAEQDNGTLSGWMYTVNGSSTNSGVAEQKVKAGDSIVFFYTDDYTKERGSENFGSVDNNISSSGGASSAQKPNEQDKTDVPKDETVIGTTAKFTDVSESDWYYDAVLYAQQNKLFNGVSETEFEPNSSMTRGMVATVIYRLAGEPETNGNNPFTDVSEDAYYAKAVVWAYENGIINGVSETKFAPDECVTREQLAAVIYRYAKFDGAAPEGAWAIRLEYADLADIDDYAVEAVMYCKLKGIMQGDDNNNFLPKNDATRAEVAAILMRYTEK